MRSLVVAKKDYRDAIRSWTLWALVLGFVAFTSGMVLIVTNSGILGLYWPVFLSVFQNVEVGVQTEEFVLFLLGPTEIIVPIVALIITYTAIAGERESGSARFLFSMPLTRWDVFAGKFIGRTAVLSTGLVAGFAVTAVITQYLIDDFRVGPYILFIFLTLLLATAWVSIGVSLSAIVRTKAKAVLAVGGTYTLLSIFSGFVGNFVWFILNNEFVPPPIGRGGPPDAPGWFFFLNLRLGPGQAFKGAVVGMLVGPSEYTFAPAVGTDMPIFLTPGFAILILLFWVIAPFAVGYLWLSHTEIG